MLENTRRPSIHDIEGSDTSPRALIDGDWIAMPVRWFDDDRPLHFKVVNTFHDDAPKLEGVDGHRYTLNTWDGKVLCNTDDKAGSHRGNFSGTIKRL